MAYRIFFLTLCSFYFLTSAELAAARKLTELPTAGDLVKAERAKYEAEKQSHAAVDEKVALAEKAVDKARDDYNRVIEKDWASINDARQGVETVKAEREKAYDEWNDAEKLSEKLRPRRGKEPTQEYRQAADKAREARKVTREKDSELEAAESKLFSQRLSSLGDGNNDAGAQGWLTALQKMDLAKKEQDAADKKLISAFHKYIGTLRRYPPPFLKTIKIEAGGETYYSALWVPGSTDSRGRGFAQQLAALNKTEDDLSLEIAKLNVINANFAEARLVIAERLYERSDESARFAREYGNSKILVAVLPALIEVAGLGVDLVTTGLAGTAAEKSAKFLPVATDALIGKSGAAVAMLGLGGNEEAAEFDEKQLNTKGAGGIILSDAIEKAVSSAVPEAIPTQLVIKNLPKALPKGYITALRKGLPKTIVETALKSVVTHYFNGKADAAEMKLMANVIRSAADTKLFDQLRLRDRELIERGRRLKVALVDVQYRREQLFGSSNLVKIKDRRISDLAFRKGVNISLTFTQGLSDAPIFKIGDQTVLNLRKNGTVGDKWSGTIRGNHKHSKSTQLPISVSLKKQSQPYDILDGDPRTPVYLDLAALEWKGAEAVPDMFHKLAVSGDRGNLTGYWQGEGGSGKWVVYINQLGSDIKAEYVSSIATFNPGDLDFNANIIGADVFGEGNLRIPMPGFRKCPVTASTPLIGIINGELTKISMSREVFLVNLSNCKVTRSNQRLLNTYSRLVDERGDPYAERGSWPGKNSK